MASPKTQDKPRYTNKLEDAFSPYLRQHMHNPIDWYPWGEEALTRAKEENKPILISIGYATCYWCHVLEREVFTEEDVAGLMNENFINIKIDREVRPDLDEIYMFATQLMTGRGGWPNNVFLTPDLLPFAAVTYLPKDRWIALSENIAGLWRRERDKITDQTRQMKRAFRTYLAVPTPTETLPPLKPLAVRVTEEREKYFDNRHGGFGTGTKFPQEAQLLYLLEYANRFDDKADTAFSMAKISADHMIAGGIHDHVGGGFHRYATDRRWRVPHFEKMLYNQGLMATVLARLFSRTKEPVYRRTLERLLSFVKEDMTASNDGFYSAWDAETEAVEGAFYVWTETDVQDTLSPADFKFLMERYDLEPLPEFPGHKHPEGGALYRTAETIAEEEWSRLEAIFATLKEERETRKKPLRDEKQIVSWNGMMIAGFAEAGEALEKADYIKTAEAATRFILENQARDDGRLYRIHMDGASRQNAFLEDYAWLLKALATLARVTGDEEWLDNAKTLFKTIEAHFYNKDTGACFLTDGSEDLPVRLQQGDDSSAFPSANAVLADAFADMYLASGDESWRGQAETLALAFGGGLNDQPAQFSHLIGALIRLKNSEPKQGDTAMPSAKQEKTEADRPAQKGPEARTGAPLASGPEGLKEKSRDHVKVTARLRDEYEDPSVRSVDIEIGIEDGWHIHANPVSVDFLIPTSADIQTEEETEVEVTYPAGKKRETPTGTLHIYEDIVTLTATVRRKDKKPLSPENMRALVQLQACRGELCAPASQIACPVEP